MTAPRRALILVDVQLEYFAGPLEIRYPPHATSLPAIAAALVLSERAVEKHTNSIFSKLGLSEERNLNRRVKAVLLYLAGTGQPED